MFRWGIFFLVLSNIFCQDDGLPPNFVYLEPIQDYYANSPLPVEIIITDRNQIDRVSLFYRFNDNFLYNQIDMEVGSQPVIYNTEIPLDEVVAGTIEYYFWAKDIYGNEATWPIGGEDLPMILPIYIMQQEKTSDVGTIQVPLVEGYTAPEKLEDNLPYYLQISMLAPLVDVKYEEGVPIVVLSIFDPENIVDLNSIRLLIDNEEVNSFISIDMATYVPVESFNAGYHIIKFDAKNISGEILVKEFKLIFINLEKSY